MQANPSNHGQADPPSGATESGVAHEAPSKRPFESANDDFQHYQSRLAGLQSEAEQRFQAASDKHSEHLQKAQYDAFKPAQESFLQYQIIYHKFQADSAETPVANVYRAQLDYQEAYQNSMMSAQKIFEERHQAYVEEMQAIQADVSAAWHDAFVEYVRAIKATIMDIDADTVEAWTLSSIGQSMLSAAVSAQSAETGPAAR
jgi:hypothetical protein